MCKSELLIVSSVPNSRVLRFKSLCGFFGKMLSNLSVVSAVYAPSRSFTELNILCDKLITLVSHPAPSCLAAATTRWQPLTGMWPKPLALAQQACTANCWEYRARWAPLACIPDAPNFTSTKCHRPFLSTHTKSAIGDTPRAGAGKGTCESTGVRPRAWRAVRVASAASAARCRHRACVCTAAPSRRAFDTASAAVKPLPNQSMLEDSTLSTPAPCWSVARRKVLLALRPDFLHSLAHCSTTACAPGKRRHAGSWLRALIVWQAPRNVR